MSADGLTYWNGSTWESLLSSDGSKIWDGTTWIAYTAPAAEVSDRPWWLHADAEMPELEVRAAAPPSRFEATPMPSSLPQPAMSGPSRAELVKSQK